MKNSFIIDVEADGPCPGLYNMINFGIVSVENMEKTFFGELKPDVENGGGIPEARAVSNISYETQLTYPDPVNTMLRAFNWITENSDQDSRLVFWSDNPAFDWQFWNYYCHKYANNNPFGFSARRIGDLYAGYQKSHKKTVQWKRFRETPHDHNPINDALGNAQALLRIVTENDIPDRRNRRPRTQC